MPDTEQQPTTQEIDPNYIPVYKGGTQPTLVEKGATKPSTDEDVFDDCGRVLFGD